MFHSGEGGIRKTIRDKELLRQVRLTRYQNGQVNDVLKLLEEANRQIRQELRKTKSISTKHHYIEMSKAIEGICKKFRGNVDGKLDITDLIENEINFQRELFRTEAGIELSLPNEKMIRSAVHFKPFAQNSNYRMFLDGISNGLYDTWDNAIRTGYITGLTTQQIVSNVMGGIAKNGIPARYGTIKMLYDSVERNTRTYLQSMASSARNEMFRHNRSVFSGFQFLATLDRRTCMVCGNLDGKVYDSISAIPDIPLHFNCRCTIVPLIKGIDVGNDERASMNGYVDGSLTYKEWLEELSEADKLQVLGRARYELYSRGEPLDSFVYDNRILSIDEL